MGQYHIIANLKKLEYLRPYAFGDMAKFKEFADGFTMTGLALLLAESNGMGGGDLNSKNPIVGSWAGNPVVVAGDYAPKFQNVPVRIRKELHKKCRDSQFSRTDLIGVTDEQREEYAGNCCNLFHAAEYGLLEDISWKVLDALTDDDDYAEKFREGILEGGGTSWFKEHLPQQLRSKLNLPQQSEVSP